MTDTIYINNRGKQHPHINAYLKRQNIPHERRRLDIGDYQIADKPIAITVFGSIQDFASAILDNKGYFWKQLRKAKEKDMATCYLIESDEVKSVRDLPAWKDKSGKIDSERLESTIVYDIFVNYRTEFIFTRRSTCPSELVDLLSIYDRTQDNLARNGHWGIHIDDANN